MGSAPGGGWGPTLSFGVSGNWGGGSDRESRVDGITAQVPKEPGPHLPAADQSTNPVTMTPGLVQPGSAVGGGGSWGLLEASAGARHPANGCSFWQLHCQRGARDPLTWAPRVPPRPHHTQGALATSITWLLQEDPSYTEEEPPGPPQHRLSQLQPGSPPSLPLLTCGGPPERGPRAWACGLWDPATHRGRETRRHLPDLLGL